MNDEHVRPDDVEYEAPVLFEVGAFDEVTLGRPGWGFDATWTCHLAPCY